MSLPPLPPIGDLPLVKWLSDLRASFASMTNRLAALEGAEGGVSIEELNARLAALESNSGIVQRVRVDHYDYPNDVYDDGATSASPVTLATHVFDVKSADNVIWVTGTIAHSNGSAGPDADGATAELHVNGVKVDDRQSFIGQSSYSLLPVLLQYQPTSAGEITIEIKAWSTTSAATGTRWRSCGTYFIIEEVRSANG